MPTPADAPVGRVLMTADAVGGVWPYSRDLANGLLARGVEVELAVMGPPPADDEVKALRRAGVELLHHPARLEWMPDAWADVDRAGDWLLARAAQFRPDLVHLNGYVHANLSWGVPVVVVAHSCVRTWWRAVHGRPAPDEWQTYTRRVRAGLEAAATVVAPTRAMLQGLRREYHIEFSGQVIPNGSSVLARPSVHAVSEPFVLASGRMWDEAKNIAAVCDAAASLSWPTFVAGETENPCGGRFEPGNAVRSLGRLSPDAMADWLGRAAVFVAPARYEPFGLCVLEAAAAGCALVLGDIPSLRENWEGRALFVPPDDRAALRETLARVIRDGALRTRLAAAARRHARQFTVETMAERYRRLYTHILSAAAAA